MSGFIHCSMFNEKGGLGEVPQPYSFFFFLCALCGSVVKNPIQKFLLYNGYRVRSVTFVSELRTLNYAEQLRNLLRTPDEWCFAARLSS